MHYLVTFDITEATQPFIMEQLCLVLGRYCSEHLMLSTHSYVVYVSDTQRLYEFIEDIETDFPNINVIAVPVDVKHTFATEKLSHYLEIDNPRPRILRNSLDKQTF